MIHKKQSAKNIIKSVVDISDSDDAIDPLVTHMVEHLFDNYNNSEQNGHYQVMITDNENIAKDLKIPFSDVCATYGISSDKIKFVM